MRYRFWIVLAVFIGFAQFGLVSVSFGQMTPAECPECTGIIRLGDESAVPVVSCPDCGLDLAIVSLPSSSSDPGGTVDGSQCKLANGQTCAVDDLGACMPLASEELEDWGGDPDSSAASPEEAAGAEEPAQ